MMLKCLPTDCILIARGKVVTEQYRNRITLTKWSKLTSLVRDRWPSWASKGDDAMRWTQHLLGQYSAPGMLSPNLIMRKH